MCSGPWGGRRSREGLEGGRGSRGSPARPTGDPPASRLLQCHAPLPPRTGDDELKAWMLRQIYHIYWMKLHLRAVVSKDPTCFINPQRLRGQRGGGKLWTGSAELHRRWSPHREVTQTCATVTKTPVDLSKPAVVRTLQPAPAAFVSPGGCAGPQRGCAG